MSAERRPPLAGVPARAMVVVFLVVTFALTWLMFLPMILLLILLHASGNFWSDILPLGPLAVDAAWVGEILVFGLAAAIVFVAYRGPARERAG